jgi:hypothetical protein
VVVVSRRGLRGRRVSRRRGLRGRRVTRGTISDGSSSGECRKGEGEKSQSHGYDDSECR